MRDRFIKWCTRVQWAPMYERHFGLSIDYDGEYEGSGALIRIKWPTFVTRWAAGFLPPPEPTNREDISDILLASLMRGAAMAMTLPRIGSEFTPPTVVWAEDIFDATER